MELKEQRLTRVESSSVQIVLLDFHFLCVVQTCSASPKQRHDLAEEGIWEQIQAQYRQKKIDRAVQETEPLQWRYS
jgi:hypothetical protein